MEKLDGLATRLGAKAQCASPLPPSALRRLEGGVGSDNTLMPESAFPRARRTLGLAGWAVYQAKPDAVLAFVAISRRVSPGRLAEYAWGRLIQWATYLAKTRDVYLAMHEAAAGTDAACFSDSPALNGPVPGCSCAGASIQFSTGDLSLAGRAMSGAIWARCLVPPKPGDCSAAAELVMAAMAAKEVMAYRVQARELEREPRGPPPPYLDATAVLHGTLTEQVLR